MSTMSTESTTTETLFSTLHSNSVWTALYVFVGNDPSVYLNATREYLASTLRQGILYTGGAPAPWAFHERARSAYYYTRGVENFLLDASRPVRGELAQNQFGALQVHRGVDPQHRLLALSESRQRRFTLSAELPWTDTGYFETWFAGEPVAHKPQQYHTPIELASTSVPPQHGLPANLLHKDSAVAGTSNSNVTEARKEIEQLLCDMGAGRPLERSTELLDLCARTAAKAEKTKDVQDIKAWADRLAKDLGQLTD